MFIDGETLQYALLSDLQSQFVKLCMLCKVVFCCRVSPLQKAEVVELVRKHRNAVTLAIGDGANDIAMIRKAHIGVGISGVEGLQAAFVSDYSIAQFRFLKRLLLVHGIWNYFRLGKLIVFSFYKNIFLFITEMWYANYSGWSGQIIFERRTIFFYNVILTALPPLAIGLFDQNWSEDIIFKFPILYKQSQNGKAFGLKVKTNTAFDECYNHTFYELCT